ncbi:MAG: glycosyl hydrolase family 32 [Bryobacteraceae bacterium]
MNPWYRRDFLRATAAMVPAAAIFGSEPAPVRIDVGRQLFVDDFLIAETSLKRAFHKPRIHEGSPVLKPETPLEMNDGYCPVACPFQDGIFYDPKDRLFKIWYHAGWFDGTAYAYSEDGIRWTRPNLDIEPGTNRVLPRRDPYQRDGAGTWLDLETTNPRERFKMFVYFRKRVPEKFRYREINAPVESQGGYAYVSADGIHWSEPVPTGPCGDNTNFFYNPFRKTWFYSIRTFNKGARVRSYRECADFLKGANWTKQDVNFFAAADDRDLPEPGLGYPTQLYNLDAVAYESLMLGVFAIHRGPPNEICEKGGFPKITDLTLAYSRDGIHWDRPDRSAFLACSRKPGTWNRGYLHSSGGVCLIVGDELRFYFGAFSGISPRLGGWPYAGGSTGLAILRRDGFASMDSSEAGGALTTRPVIFNGRCLYVNANASGGELRVEALGPDGKSIGPFTRENCIAMRAAATRHRITWKSPADLAGLRNRPVRFRFHSRNAQLFSFWISSDESGASRGYVAAGGPGFEGPIDT